MKIATWNINGIKARIENLRQWLSDFSPDIVCLQEIKSVDEGFPRVEIESLGYHVVKLDRVYFAGLTKKNLPRGRWRYLTQEEVNFLKQNSFE